MLDEKKNAVLENMLCKKTREEKLHLKNTKNDYFLAYL